MEEGALPTVLVIGGMKCGTSALHAHLDRHPAISMAPGKELNFFFGPQAAPPGPPGGWWREGQWHRGTGWYAAQLDARAPVRGESSPGYTDPAHPEVAARVRAVVPDVRLVHLVRDPLERAVSQWRHHAREGDERRAVGEALLDPGSQYLARSRHHERLAPFRALFPDEQLLVVVQERLLADPRAEMRRVLEHLGLPGRHRDPAWARVHHGAVGPPAELPRGLREQVWERVGDDVERLRGWLGDDLREWRSAAGR